MSRTRRAAAAAAVTALAATSLVATASTSIAGSSDRAEHAFTFASTGGSVATTIASDEADASPLGLLDYIDPAQADVAWAAPSTTEAMSVTVLRQNGVTETMRCLTGRTLYYSGITVAGRSGDWANLGEGRTANVRVRLSCTTPDNTVHHLHWGEHRLSSTKWMSPAPTADCVTMTRNDDVFTITANGCVVQDEIVAWKPSKQLSTSNVTADFSATISRGALLRR